ncbi:MAG: hypothetical protein EZS26_000898 [Candidatus Ordinivivax streblomastigis]|uniref:T9SS C-terminal target domain-containing protein n=1 Tax=Candidatus Ordinivivax streblomastigis TaxID=2540710 RepID=A0A5M8P3G5_9BACT|nr:MAG: hypothetical protein EZS26_000898 [Candidatus Ordinivivax streblomastigis]
MKQNYFLLVLFLLISIHFNFVWAADNHKLHDRNNADSDAAALVSAGTYSDIETAQRAIYLYQVPSSPWKFGDYASATQKFTIYTDANATWQGTQWSGNVPITMYGESWFPNANFSPVIFFIAPETAIYKVNTTFDFRSANPGNTQGTTLFQFKAKDGLSVVNMNFSKSYSTNNKIQVSDFYVHLQEGDTIAFNQTCSVWGDPFCVWANLQVLGNNSGVAFTAEEANESGFYFDSYLEETDFSYLNAKIVASEILIAAAVPGTTLGTYPASAIASFQNAIDAAKTFVAQHQTDATQANINTQLATLTVAYNAFTATYKASVVATDEAGAEHQLLSGLYLIKLKGTDLYLTAPAAKGTTATNRVSYQPLRDADVQNCQKWNIQYNRNAGFTNPARYSFVSGTDSDTNWTENDASVVGHLDEGGYFRDKNTEETQIGPEGLYHNFTVHYDETAYGLYNVGTNRPLNISATIGAEIIMSYETTTPVQFLYELISAPNAPTSIAKMEVNQLKIISVEKGIRIITDQTAPVSIYTIAGILVKQIRVNADETIALNLGIYIVKQGNTVQKIIIR